MKNVKNNNIVDTIRYAFNEPLQVQILPSVQWAWSNVKSVTDIKLQGVYQRFTLPSLYDLWSRGYHIDVQSLQQ